MKTPLSTLAMRLSARPPASNTQLTAIEARLAVGDLAGAIQACRKRLASTPDDAEAHRHLGQLLAASGDFLPAYRSAQQACELAPDDPRSWSDLGRIHAMQGKFDNAARCFTEAIQADSRHADGWHNLGTALKKLGDKPGAFTALKNALMLDPTRAETYLNLGNLLIASDQFEDAVQCFERAAEHDPKLAQARSRLAHELSACGKVRRAESLFRQALGLNPDHVQGWFGLGRTLEDLGDAENALACYEQVLKRHPNHAMALGQYLALVRDDVPAPVLENAKAAAPSDAATALIGYGLLKYHDRRKDYAAAAQAGIAANAARRAQAGVLDRAALTQRIDRIVQTYTRDFFAEHRRLGLGTDQPVFIVGLPRSGTTLTEQILSAHPALHGAGELPDLSRIASRCVARDEEPWQAATRLDEMTSRERALEYLHALGDGAPKSRLRISDKSPLNFFQLAFAAVLFPNARVVHCLREPRDNALSIWMENFASDQRYATDFDDLAFFTSQYRRLMAHWREHLPLKMLDMQYENTVADLEAQARKLMRFLGVPWDAGCLDFHSNDRAVQTPSRWQVRQPIYTRSVSRWKTYAPYLPGLVSAFAPEAERPGA
ncbi:MAG: tetratricopeptide repeat-containing sulfotransferase family protein [Panacagrimonas sp.]